MTELNHQATLWIGHFLMMTLMGNDTHHIQVKIGHYV